MTATTSEQWIPIFDDVSPIKRIEDDESYRPIPATRKAYLNALALSSIALTASAVASGGTSLVAIGMHIAAAPLILKIPVVASAVMYAREFRKAPKRVKASSVRLIPDSWKVPVGVDRNGRTHYHDFEKIPHALVTGTTGGGKTVLLNAILYSLMKTRGPDELEIFIIDMKGGASFAHFESLPHIQNVIADTERARDVLGGITRTMFNRLELIREDRSRLLQPRKFKRILVVIDEGAELSPSFAVTSAEIEIRKNVMSFLSSLARIGREPCINVLYATQRPSNEALPVAIRELMDAKFAFRQGERSSKLTLGNDNEAASKLPNIKGRMIYSNCGNEVEVQGVYVPEDELYGWIRSYGLVQDYKPTDNVDAQEQSISSNDSPTPDNVDSRAGTLSIPSAPESSNW